MSLTNTTVTGNSSPSGGGIRRDGGLTTLTNTTIANNASGGDCSGAMTSLGHNLDGDGSCSLSVASGDLPSTDPLLGPLANNGGPTFTHALLDGSPAIDSGYDSVLDPPHNLFTDQRGPGFPRLQRAHVDIGAYEAEVFSVPIGHLTFVEVQRDGVGGVDGLDGTFSVTVSLDGKHLYATSINDDAVAVFRRDSATGALTFVEVQRDGVGGVDGLNFANSVTVSPDGKHLYASGAVDDAVAVFRRDSATGALTFVEVQRDGVGGVHGLGRAYSVTVSPDGKHLYAASNDGVAMFRRNSTTGALSFVEVHKEDGGGGLQFAYSMTVSPDWNHLYAARLFDDAVAVFRRNSATGGLTFVEVHGLGRARSVTVSPDGKHLYAARLFDDAVAVFRRNSTTGALTFMEAHKDGVGGVDGVVDGGLDSFGHGPADTPVYFARSVEVSPDGKYLYAAAFNAFDTVAVFRRNSTTGALSFVEVQKDGVGGVDGLGDVRSMTVSPDGKHLYVAGNRDDAVAVFSVASANLSVSKSVDEPSPQEGERVTFTVTVTHNGPRAATGVVVSDVIPSGLTLQSATPSDGAYSTGSGDWTLASSLASGATATLMLVTVVDAGTAGSTITNVATVTASDQADPDAGDSATVTVPPLHTCNGLPATIVGSPGPDHIVGTPGDDVIVALGWDDTVLGLEGNDTICLGDGDDFGDGGPGRDRIFGEDGDDDIRDGGSRDRLYGGRGEDVLRGGRGNDRLYGGRHDDVLKGGDGRDRLFGQKGNDVLLGGDGYDLLVGARGDDVLLGRAGDDSHDCGPGLDFANGGDGTDTATGDCESTSAIP